MLMKYIIQDAGLSYDTNETILKDAFGQYGEIIEGNMVGQQYLLSLSLSITMRFLRQLCYRV